MKKPVGWEYDFVGRIRSTEEIVADICMTMYFGSYPHMLADLKQLAVKKTNDKATQGRIEKDIKFIEKKVAKP